LLIGGVGLVVTAVLNPAGISGAARRARGQVTARFAQRADRVTRQPAVPTATATAGVAVGSGL
jgi:hypothetical protein